MERFGNLSWCSKAFWWLLSFVEFYSEKTCEGPLTRSLQYSSKIFSISLPSQWVIKLSGRIKIFLSLCDSTHFGGNTAMETQVLFSGALSGIAEGWLESCVLYLAWPEWKGLKFYSPMWFHPFGWKHRGIAGGSQGEYYKITCNIWVEPWVGLKGANKSAHWDGWDNENPLELYCKI